MVMTADELKERRIFLTLTQAQLANRFGLSDRTIRNYESKWEDGATPIPKTFEIAMDALELEEK